MIFERRVYEKLVEWKKECQGEKALLIEGARRIGKSTIVEAFGGSEYKSYLMIDFNDVSDTILDAFQNYLGDLDTFFLILATEYGIQLYERDTLIIFDEIQRFSRARQSIKKLVADGRYDYIETGSLISVKENVKDITIPSEERKLRMYPMDFEEFALALGEGLLITYIKKCFQEKKPLEAQLHAKAMLLFRQFLIVGGMPKSVAVFIEQGRSMVKSDQEKRDILSLYRDDIMKMEGRYKSKVLAIYDQIPAFLSKHERRIIFSNIEKNGTFSKFHDTFFWLSDSMIANECFNCSDPNIALSLNEDRTYVKCYMGDTGLLISHTFDENEIVEEDLYRQLLLGRLNVNEGMFFENAIAQELVAKGHKLFFYTSYNKEKRRNDIEIDFLITNKSKMKYKVFPIEVKSSERYTVKSLERFLDKFTDRAEYGYVIHTKNLAVKENIIYIPAYMTMCL